MFIVLVFEFFVYYMLWLFGLFLRYRYLVKVFFVIKIFGFFFRGKGDNYRLGYGFEDYVRYFKQIEALFFKKVKDIVIGFLYCMVIIEDGELYGWGRNEQGQLGNFFISNFIESIFIAGMEGKNIIGVVCGLIQVRNIEVDYDFF